MTFKERVARALKEANLSPTAAAKKMGGVGDAFVRDILTGKKRSVTGERLKRLAEVLETSPDWLLGNNREHGPAAIAGLEPLQTFEIPMRGSVAVGAWREDRKPSEALENGEAETIRVAPVPGYTQEDLYGLRVADSSFDAEYAPGETTLIVTPATLADVVEGDHVIIRRERAGLYELSVKEIARDETGGWVVRSRSRDPGLSQSAPIGAETGKIVALVLGAIRLRNRRAPVKNRR